MSRWDLGSLLASSLLAACVDPTTPAGADSDVLARSGASFHVVLGAPPGGDGSGARPLGVIQEGIDMAEARGGGVIHVGPGTWLLTSPLEILGSDIKIKGSGETLCVPDLEHPDVGVVPCGDVEDPTLHPNGQTTTGTETRIAPAPLYSSAAWGDDPANANIRPLIKVGCGESGQWEDTCPDGVLDGIEISGLTIDARAPNAASPNRPALYIRRTVDFVVEGNVIAGGSFGMFVSGSTGSIAGNFVGGVPGACGLCIHAPISDGTGEDEPDVDIVGNTLQGNLVGAFLFGSSSGLRQLGDHLDVDLRHNAFRRNSFVGVRIGPQIRPRGWPGSEQVSGNVTAGLIGNEYHGNGAAYSFDHSFGYRIDNNGPDVFDQQFGGVLGPCAPRWYTATFDISLVDEVIGPDNGRSEITFTRPSPVNPVLWQYTHYAIYEFYDPGNALHAFAQPGDPDYAQRVRINHPAYDPYQQLNPTGTTADIDWCKPQRVYDAIGGPALHPRPGARPPETPLDQALGNTLRINGVVMPHSRVNEAGVECDGPSITDCFPSCTDGDDNDDDGSIDDDDPDCRDTCVDQADNDGDGFVDGADQFCEGSSCGAVLACAQACVAMLVNNPSFDLLGCVVVSCPSGDHPFGLPLDPICPAVADKYFDAIGCAGSSGCLPYDSGCLTAACGPLFGACQASCLE